MFNFVLAEDLNIALKQGALFTWKNQTVKNLTTFELAKTQEVESWGKWNILWAGWSLDCGFAYDASSISNGAILIGREFGTIGNYLPINFPLKDKITITLYPAGVYIDNIFDHPKSQGCSGGAIIKLSIKF